MTGLLGPLAPLLVVSAVLEQGPELVEAILTGAPAPDSPTKHNCVEITAAQELLPAVAALTT